MDRCVLSVLLIFSCWIGYNHVVAFDCTSNDDSCTWIKPEYCKNSSGFCGNTAECLIVTKSVNSSYSFEINSSYNHQYQCRCPVGNTNNCNPYATPNVKLNCITREPTNTNVSIEVNGENGLLLNIVYAEMWRCPDGDNSVMQCPSGGLTGLGCKNATQLLPNVFALVRFWCQFKNTTCEFDSSLILSHVGKSIQLPEQSALPEHYIFESGSGMISSVNFSCGNSSQTVFDDDSCYRLTPTNLEWGAARSHCLQLGGDLAHFTEDTNFASILRGLDKSTPSNITYSTAVHIWFKWYTWTGDQRMPQHFLQYTDRFQCPVYDFLPEEGTNPLAGCKAGTRSKNVRGLCVFSPRLFTDNFDYVELSCLAKCGFPGYPDYCWPEAEADSKVYVNCPSELNGKATWTCGIDGKWKTPSPDLSNCTNPVVEDSINQVNNDIANGEDPGKSLNSLTNVVKENGIAPGNLVQLDQTVSFAIEQQTSLMVNTTDASLREESCKNFTISVIDLNGVVLGNASAFWGLNWEARSEAISEVQKNVDDTLFLLAENLLDKMYQYGNISDQNIAIQVENKQQIEYNDTTYAYVATDEDQLILPAGFPNSINTTNTRLSFVTYNEFQDLLYGDTLAQLSAENQTTFEPIRQVVVTKVLGATLGQPNGSIPLKDGTVEILLSTLNLDRYEVNKTTATCVFWDSLTQEWSSEGCIVVGTNGTSTTCQCDHLTNFAVLMDINGLFENEKKTDYPALDYITIIGGSISIVCLTLAVIIFYWVRTLRRDFRFVIHRNLCVNLLIADILFLAGIEAIANRDLCLSIAVFLHFFFLCAFSWMVVEGLYLYFLITKVFDGSGLKQWQYYVIGYGVPVLTVTITLAVTKTEAYLGDPFLYCWLSYENGAIWAFAGPVAAVVCINIVFLSLAVSVRFKLRRNPAEIKENKQNFRWIYGVISLTFILGITWMFGFLFFGQSSIVFAYIFTILNSLQGMFIFITFCVINKKVRKDLHRQFITSQRIQRVALYFSIELSDLNVASSLNNTGSYNVQRQASQNKNRHSFSNVSEVSIRLY